MIERSRSLWDFLRTLAGPAIWAAHFFVVYGVEWVICTRITAPESAMRWVVLVATLVALAGVTTMLITTHRRRRSDSDDVSRFMLQTETALAAISGAAILAVATSALLLSACLAPSG